LSYLPADEILEGEDNGGTHIDDWQQREENIHYNILRDEQALLQQRQDKANERSKSSSVQCNNSVTTV
jgi:hypothetical protein